MLNVTLPYGEIVDRIVILELKCARIDDPKRREAAVTLRDSLRSSWERAALPTIETLPEYAALAAVNAELWEVEDALRACERAHRFDSDFIALARRVYLANDRRAQLKAAIDAALGSPLSEPKWHR